MTPVPPHAARHGAKDRHSNSGVVVNQNYDYSGSMTMVRRCARRLSALEAGLTPLPRRPHRVTSGVLNRLHVDSSNFRNNVPNKPKEEKKQNPKGKNENEKGVEKRHHKNHHEN